jgi:hypothetical protein
VKSEYQTADSSSTHRANSWDSEAFAFVCAIKAMQLLKLSRIELLTKRGTSQNFSTIELKSNNTHTGRSLKKICLDSHYGDRRKTQSFPCRNLEVLRPCSFEWSNIKQQFSYNICGVEMTEAEGWFVTIDFACILKLSLTSGSSGLACKGFSGYLTRNRQEESICEFLEIVLS